VSRTYENFIRDAQDDARSEGYTGDMLWDVAEAMLLDPEFQRLAQARFTFVQPGHLKFSVADDLCCGV
jgi:hypothetical protein